MFALVYGRGIIRYNHYTGGIGEETCKEFTEERFQSIFENSEQCFSKGDNGQCRLAIV